MTIKAFLKNQIRSAARKSNHWLYKPVDNFRSHDVMSEDWDVLVILDGCRYDTFKKVNWIEGELDWRHSCESDSWEFITRNFIDKKHHDTVYITANPFSKLLDGTEFHKLIELLSEWDEDLETIPPRKVVRKTIETASNFPNKRIIVHLMQPHYPFIGEKGKQLAHRGHEQVISGEFINDDENKEPTVWEQLRSGDVEAAEVYEAYEENTEIAVDAAEEIINSVDGKTVITADHGNLFGERLYPIPIQEFGHPRGVRSKALNKVPWFTIENGDREIRSDPPRSSDSSQMADLGEKLEALGYK